jgi:hypothetical protein
MIYDIFQVLVVVGIVAASLVSVAKRLAPKLGFVLIDAVSRRLGLKPPLPPVAKACDSGCAACGLCASLKKPKV